VLHFVKERALRRLADIEAAVFRERVPLAPLRFHQANLSPDEALAADLSDWPEIAVGHTWQAAESAAWLRSQFTVPEAWPGQRVALFVDFKGAWSHYFIWTASPAQALDYNHPDVLLHDPAQGGETHTFAIEAYSPTRGGTFTLQAADLRLVDRDAYALFYDWTGGDAALDVLDANSREYQALLVGLDSAMNALDYSDQSIVDGPVGTHRDLPARIARPAFTPRSRRPAKHCVPGSWTPFPADTNRDPAMTLSGHAHIDVAWLWSLENTRKKVGRTFATALRLMDEFPDYVFTQSQPQLYEYAKQRYPNLYERIKQRVAEGGGSRPAACGSRPTATCHPAKA
jgi:alpha-mannosidase